MTKTRHAKQDEDADLVIAWRQGKTPAFEELVGKYQKRMFNIAYRCTGNYKDACEVTDDAFVAAYRGRNSFHGVVRFSAWLTGITVKLSRNRHSKLQTGRNDSAPSSDIQHMAGGVKVPDSAPALPEWHDLPGRIQGCLNSLDADTREMIVLRDMQGFSYEEICDILSIREGTINSRLTRARELIKDCLKRAEGAL
jgi:RNA polymerase sigma-70 factor, ECF subfamily